MMAEWMSRLMWTVDVFFATYAAYNLGKIAGFKEHKKIVDNALDTEIKKSMERVIAAINETHGAVAGIKLTSAAELFPVETKH